MTHSSMIVGRKTGIELNATLQLKNMNWIDVSKGTEWEENMDVLQ